MAQVPTPAQVAQVRGRYLAGDPVRSIVAESGVTSMHYVYCCLRGKLDDGSGVPLAPIPLRSPDKRIYGKSGSRRTIVGRMWRTAERQVEQIEQRLKAAGLEPGERESNARTFATLVRTLRDLAAFDEAKQARKRKPQSEEEDDDPVPVDIGELRRELARRIDALVAARTDS